MQVMHAAHAADLRHGAAECVELDVRRRRFEEHVDRFAHQTPGASDYEPSHHDRGDRVGDEPALPAHEHRGHDRGDRAEQVGEHVEIGGPDIH